MVRPPTVSMGVQANPGASVGTRMIEMPLCLAASGSVRQASQIQSAFCALLVKIFCPSITQASPSRTALVRNAARSVPASGSL